MKKTTRLLPVLLAFAGLAAACSSTYERADLIEELTTGESPITEDQANCIADGVEAEFSIDRLNSRGDLTAEEEEILTSVTFDCILGG